MTGIGMAAASGKTAVAPPPESYNVIWNGANPYHMNAASGTTGNAIVAVVANGSGNYSFTWTVLSNPSGKLSLTNASGTNSTIDWSGFTVSEGESISVQVDVHDNVTGFSGSDSISVNIHRDS